MTNNTSRDILSNALATIDTSALRQIANHCTFSLELAVQYAEDTEALAARNDVQQLTRLRDACTSLIAMK